MVIQLPNCSDNLGHQIAAKCIETLWAIKLHCVRNCSILTQIMPCLDRANLAVDNQHDIIKFGGHLEFKRGVCSVFSEAAQLVVLT
jgi:hypothetical protein